MGRSTRDPRRSTVVRRQQWVHAPSEAPVIKSPAGPITRRKSRVASHPNRRPSSDLALRPQGIYLASSRADHRTVAAGQDSDCSTTTSALRPSSKPLLSSRARPSHLPPFLVCAPQNRKVVAVSRAFAGSARTLNGYPAGMLLPEAGHPMEGEVVGVVMVASTTQAVVKGRSGDGNDVVAFKLPVDVLKAVVEGVRM